jgi:uncharacterized protein DUF5681
MKHAGLRPEWKPGESGNPAGRPKGSRSKLSEAFLTDFLGAWEKFGAAALETAATQFPTIFVRVTASLLPRPFKIENDLADWTDEQLEQRIRELNAAIVHEIGTAARDGRADGGAAPSDTKH